MKSSQGIQVNNDESAGYSKCGTYMAAGYRNRLRIYAAGSGQVTREFVCRQTIKAVNWCSDSDRVLCVVGDKAVEAFSISHPEWVCALDNGHVGLTTAAWSPSGFHILTLSQFNVRITIWSLTGRSVAFIDHPILRRDQSLPFAPDGSRFGVVTRSVDAYKILIFSAASWILLSETKFNAASSATIPFGPLWSPTNRHIAIWDTLDANRGLLEVYSADDLRLVSTYSNTAHLSGITKVAWAPSGQFLLIGACNESIHVLNYITWNVLTIRTHSKVIDGDEPCDVRVESVDERSFEAIRRRPVIIKSRLKDVPPGRLPGVADIACDPTGRYLVSLSTAMPAVVWVWEMGTFDHVSTVILQRPVSHVEWTTSSLIICTRSNGVVRWSRDGVSRVRFPTESDLIVSSCDWPGPGQLSISGSVLLYMITGFSD